MRQISVRQLRLQASVWLRRVQQGEGFEVTSRGRPVALLVPRSGGSEIERLLEARRLLPPEADLLELGSPLPPQPGQPLPSTLLEELRASER